MLRQRQDPEKNIPDFDFGPVSQNPSSEGKRRIEKSAIISPDLESGIQGQDHRQIHWDNRVFRRATYAQISP